MTIGERIKRRREELKWSQRKLSDMVGYSNHSTITKIEAGQVDLPLSKIERFSEVLNIPVAELMGWEDERKPAEYDGLSDKHKALIDFAKSVPEDKVEYMLKLMKTILEME